MHTKDAGTVGELAVILHLKQAGFTVFTEVGDNSPIDLKDYADFEGVLRDYEQRT